MPETAADVNLAAYFGVSTPRTLTWITETHFYGLGCSQCAWLFRPTGPPMGSSLAEMKENHMQDCNEEFAAHDCAEQPRAKKTNTSIHLAAREKPKLRLLARNSSQALRTANRRRQGRFQSRGNKNSAKSRATGGD